MQRTLIKPLYYRPGNGTTKDILSFVERIDGVKQVNAISPVPFRFYMDKDLSKSESRYFARKDEIEPIWIEQYSKLLFDVAERVGQEDFVRECIAAKDYQRAKNTMLSMHPNFHQTDVHIEDFWMAQYCLTARDRGELDEFPKLHKAYIDIETKIADALDEGDADPKNANIPVCSLGYYDDATNSMFLAFLRDQSIPAVRKYEEDAMRWAEHYARLHNLSNCHIMGFDDDIDMILAFLQYHHKINPDIISGWNSIDFDYLFMYNRIAKRESNPDKYFCHPDLPFRRVEKWSNFAFNAVDKTCYFNPGDMTVWHDQMYVYAGLRVTSEKPAKGWGLESICEEEGLPVGKQKLPVAMVHAYHRAFNELMEYLTHDVMRLRDIEIKTNDLDQITERSFLTHTRPWRVVKKGICLHNLAIRLSDEGDIKNYTPSNNRNKEADYHQNFGIVASDGNQYPFKDFSICKYNETIKPNKGGFVADPLMMAKPELGLDEWSRKFRFIYNVVSDFDFSAEYPNIVMALLVDPENQYGKIIFVEKPDDYDPEGRFINNQAIELIKKKDIVTISEKYLSVKNADDIFEQLLQEEANGQP